MKPHSLQDHEIRELFAPHPWTVTWTQNGIVGKESYAHKVFAENSFDCKKLLGYKPTIIYDETLQP